MRVVLLRIDAIDGFLIVSIKEDDEPLHLLVRITEHASADLDLPCLRRQTQEQGQQCSSECAAADFGDHGRVSRFAN
jgi:hypothetical protein